jgi:hypothetical protein
MEMRVEISGQAGQWQGVARWGGARLDTLRGGIPRSSRAKHGPARQATARRGPAGPGKHTASHGVPQFVVPHGSAWCGSAGHGGARLGKHTVPQAGAEVCGEAGLRMAWRVRAGLGEAWQTHCPSSGDRSLRQCAPRCGEAGQGEAWQGLANTQHPTGC